MDSQELAMTFMLVISALSLPDNRLTMTFILTKTDHIAATYLAELRDVQIQKDRARFRRNLERIGQTLAYELSKTLTYQDAEVVTPLGVKTTRQLSAQPLLVSVLRAGMPLFNGFLEVFDHADSAFIGAYRGPHNADNSFDIELEYMASPSVEGRDVILLDPMLATGKSLVRAVESLKKYGNPASVHIVAVIAAEPGIAYVRQQLPEASIWIGDADQTLNSHSYIIPGLGDAGDLAFGPKL